MVFPATALGTAVQLKMNGGWTNVVRYDTNTKILQKDGVTISRGVNGVQDKTPAGTCRWTWQDPNGVFNNENPRSPYFGLLQRNTPVRVYVPRTIAALNIVSTYGNANNNGLRCSCPDTVATSITGDIDVRVDIEPKRWTRWGVRNVNINPGVMPLMVKNASTADRSWMFRLQESGVLTFGWRTTTPSSLAASSTVPVDMTQARLVVRATLDVDNGAAGYTATFYTAPTMAGPFVQLGAQVIVAGVTNIVDSTAPIELGTVNNGGDPTAALVNGFNYVGRIFRAQLYNGIAGSLVADADFTGRANGTTSFADGLGNTWTLGPTNAEITNADYRFYGELSAPVLKPNRSKNGAGLDVQVEAEAGGILRRLGSNDTPLQSPLFRFLTASTGVTPSFSPHDLWTGEDDSTSDTDRASNAVTGGAPAVIQDITFNGPDATLPGSAGCMVLGSTAPQFVGTCKAATQTTETHFIGFFKFPSIPVAEVILWQIRTANSTIVQWNFTVSATAYTLRGYDKAGTEVATKQTAFGVGAEPNKWIAYHMQLTNAAGTVSIKSEWMEVSTGLTYNSTAIGTVSYAGSNGVISSVVLSGTGLSSVRIAHVLCTTLTVANGMAFYDGTNPTIARVSFGFRGETADARFIRICQLIGVTPVIFGNQGDSEQMGAEPLDTGLNIIYECATVSGGMIIEAVDQAALEFWTLKSLYNQQGTLSLTWAQVAQGLEGTPDDTDVANDITLSRKNGGSARATLEFGPMSIQAPPNGINPVPDGPEINNFSDSRLPFLVQNLLAMRTWPTSRYPKVTVTLEHPTFTGNANLALLTQRQTLPMELTITSLPTFMPPDTLYLLVKGMTETLLSQQWKVEWTCVPYGPYITSELTAFASNPYSFKAAHTVVAGVSQQQLNAGITNSATSFAIKTLSGVLFDTTATNIPIKIGGELMTVGSVTGATSPQTMNSVTRGVNGYSAAHNANDQVIVYPTLKARL